jgi:hypothetical protein
MTALTRVGALGIGLAVAIVGTATVASAAPVNLVTNGDFSNGESGFASEYLWNSTLGYDPGVYTVSNDPALWHPNFIHLGDHTTGTGMMFIGNGSTTPAQTVWQSEAIDVEADLKYYFEAYATNVCCTDFIRPDGQSVLNFTLAFNGGPIISLGTRSTNGGEPGIWEGLSTNWISPGAGTVVLSLVDFDSRYDANDFAIDDVYFGAESTVVPEPATIVLILTGLPLARAAYRRRPKRQATGRRV